MNQGFGVIWAIGLILLWLGFTVLTAYVGQNNGLPGAVELRDVFQSLGFAALPASAPYAGTPSSWEGIRSCLKDTPGGYCYQAETNGTLQIPFVQNDYCQLYVFRKQNKSPLK